MSETRKNILCPLCNQRGIDLIGFTLHRYCPRCKLAWLKKFPRASYEGNYYTGASTVASKLYSPIERLFYTLRSSYVGFKRKKLWIDVGAGDGSFLITVRAEKKIGVEISIYGRRLIEERGIEAITDKQFLRIRGYQADVISFWHMLEHVPNPWDYLAAAKRNLSQDGLVVIGIPNMDCYEYYLFKSHWFHTPKFHLYEFSTRSIAKLLQKTGFRIRFIDHWSPEHHIATTLQSIINVTAGSQGALHRFIRRGHDATFTGKDAFWSTFWLTLGSPIIFLFWVVGSIAKKGSTIVVVAKPR